MSNTKAVWFFVLGLTALRLSLLGATDLSFDEAHYWMWSERLAPSYFSKGPGVAFAIRVSTAIFGGTEFGVRFWSPLLGAATSLLIYYFTRRLFNATAGFWAVLAINAIPLFNVGNVLMTIDPLSIFFWTAAMYAFWLALERSPNFSWFWPLTGLLVGLGFAVLIPPAYKAEGGALVAPGWLIVTYLLHTFGELSLSPVGMSSMTRLAPKRFAGLTMGAWFASISLGNLIAGIVGGNVDPEKLAQMPALFQRTSISLFAAAVLLLALVIPIRRMIERRSR